MSTNYQVAITAPARSSSISHLDPVQQIRENTKIAAIDPLKADSILARLPEINRSGSVTDIIMVLRSLLPSSTALQHYQPAQAAAVMRDLGILLGSIKRQGIEPLVALPKLEPVLLTLGRKTDMVPRDTLIHYTLWNPEGERQRRYTNYPDEIQMVNSARIAIPKLEGAIQDLVKLQTIPITSPKFLPLCQQCGEQLHGMVEAIVHVIKRVSRQVFAESLRPYFDSIRIQGREYLGPGAVEMPLFMVDQFLWSAECQEQRYLQFKAGFLPYCLPSLRQLYRSLEHRPSLLANLCQQLATLPPGHEVAIANLQAVMQLFKILIKFRRPHIKVVDQAYHKSESQSKSQSENQSEIRVRESGSGGYQADTLEYITTLTEKAIAQLQQVTQHYDTP